MNLQLCKSEIAIKVKHGSHINVLIYTNVLYRPPPPLLSNDVCKTENIHFVLSEDKQCSFYLLCKEKKTGTVMVHT